MSQAFHPRPQMLQGESVAKHTTVLPIILSLVCESDIKEVLVNLW